jgi:hypothetical protein
MPIPPGDHLPIKGTHDQPPAGSSSASDPGPVGSMGGKRYIAIRPQLTVDYTVPSTNIWARFIAWIGSCFGARTPMVQKTIIIHLNHIPNEVAEINRLARDRINQDNPQTTQQPLLGQEFTTQENLLILDSEPQTQPTLPGSIEHRFVTEERSQEIEAFYTQCLKDPIYSSLQGQDLAFLKSYLIPNLLATKDALIELRGSDRTTTFISKERHGDHSLMDFRSLVKNAVRARVIDQQSYFYEFAYQSTDSKTTEHQADNDIESRTLMSVKNLSRWKN